MKNLLPILIFLTACTPSQEEQNQNEPIDLRVQATKEIHDIDKIMSDLAVEEGFHKTLLAFADDSVIKTTDGEFPVIGKKNLESYWAGKEDTKAISWKPFRAEASRSGDMGYTIGDWTMTLPDTTYHGNYFTIWKKQADGKWKFVADGGNNTPSPAAE